MTTRTLVFSLLSGFFLSLPLPARSASSTSELAAIDTALLATDTVPQSARCHMRWQKVWNALLPTQVTLQYAGSIGMLNAGIGWHYGRTDAFETELLVGFVPKYHSDAARVTFTAKQRFIPWHCRVAPRWSIDPLTAGFAFNTISGEKFWTAEPSRYPHRYYGFSTRWRIHVFLGQRVRFAFLGRDGSMRRALSAYYEISTCDLYLVSKCTNGHYPLRKTLSLAFGLKYDF